MPIWKSSRKRFTLMHDGDAKQPTIFVYTTQSRDRLRQFAPIPSICGGTTRFEYQPATISSLAKLPASRVGRRPTDPGPHYVATRPTKNKRDEETGQKGLNQLQVPDAPLHICLCQRAPNNHRAAQVHTPPRRTPTGVSIQSYHCNHGKHRASYSDARK